MNENNNNTAEVKTEKQKNPHLFCLITGKSRPTTWAYLKDKAERLGTDVAHLMENYVSREAITQLLDGRSVDSIRAGFKDAPNTDISTDRLAELIRLNSKAKKAAEKFNVVATTTVEINEAPTEVPAETPAEAPTENAQGGGKSKKKKKGKKKVEVETEVATTEVATIENEMPAEVPAEM